MIVDLVKKPPMLFPLVGLFHVVLTLYIIWSDHYLPFPGIEWLGALWLLAYTVFWIAACDLRRWGALGYICLTIVDAAVYLAIYNHKLNQIYESPMLVIAALFSVFLLFYFKKFK